MFPPQVTLFRGFCEINRSPVAPFQVCVPVFSHTTFAVNCCPGESVVGTDWEMNTESKAVPAAATTIDRAFCALADAESATRTVKL